MRVYRWTLSPVLSGLFGGAAGCRFTPTCSAYALEALRTHGAARGVWLTTRRLCRCHPWGGCGHDPVPPTNLERGARNSELGTQTAELPAAR